MALPKFEKDMRIVSVLSDRPNAASNEHLDGLQLKQKFDEGGEALKEYINGTLIPFLAGSEAAASLGIGTISGISEATNIQQALKALKFAIDNTTTGAIPDGSLSGAKLIANAITERELSTNSVTTGKLADNAVSGTKVADNGINGEKIADGSIANRHLGDLVVENGNIADGTIDASGKLKDGSVTAKLLANDAVQEGAIKNGAVTRSKLADGAVSETYTATIPASGWTVYSNGQATQNITIPGLLTTDSPILDVDFSTAANISAGIELEEEWSKVVRGFMQAANTLRVWAKEAPTMDIPIKMVVIRK